MRGDRLGFSRVTSAERRRPHAGTRRCGGVEGAVGYLVRRNVRLKAGYQYNWRDGGRERVDRHGRRAAPLLVLMTITRDPPSVVRPDRRWPLAAASLGLVHAAAPRGRRHRHDPRHRDAAGDRARPPAVGEPARRHVGGRSRSRTPLDRQTSVVYLDNMPRGMAGEFVERKARLDQRGERFVPHIVAIGVGGTVDFPNSDPFFHNVFSLSDVRSFDLGRYATGKSKTVRFDKPGVVRVFCDIHAHMSAFIFVFAHPYFDVTDGAGPLPHRRRAGRHRTARAVERDRSSRRPAR